MKSTTAKRFPAAWRGLACTLAAALFTATVAAAPQVWKSASFLDRVDGTLTDGGANTYVVADGSVRLINLNDLNGDGNVDLVAPPDHTYNQIVDIAVLWGKSDFSAAGATWLPGDGGGRCGSQR